MGEKDGQVNSPGENPNDDNEILKNYIFIGDLFKTNDRLIKLRNTIAAAIDMGDDTKKYGEPQEKRINPSKKNEWYYIMKAIAESGVSVKGLSVVDFVEQMAEWFPQFFDFEHEEELEKQKRSLAKAIYDERDNWKQGKTKEEVLLKDTWSAGMVKVLGSAKAERLFEIAYKGLYKNLVDLKKE